MNKLTGSIIGGIAGSTTLTVVHQVLKRIDNQAPRLDLIGEEGLKKGLEKAGIEHPRGNALFAVTLAADLLSNAFYYTAIGLGKRKYLYYHGVAHGMCAGIGALTVTRPMGLSDAPVTRTPKTKLLTIALYSFGGLVAGTAMRALRKR